MRIQRLRPALLVAAFLVLASNTFADSPFAGRWLVTVHPLARQETYWILDVTEKGKELSAQIIDQHPDLKVTKIKAVKAGEKSLQINFTMEDMPVKLLALPTATKKDYLLGTLTSDNIDVKTLRMVRTTAKKLDPNKLVQRSKGDMAYLEARNLETPQKIAKAFENIVEDFPNDPILVEAIFSALEISVKLDVEKKEILQLADLYMKQAERFGPDLVRESQSWAALVMAGNKKSAKKAIEFLDSYQRAMPKDVPTEFVLKATTTRLNAMKSLNNTEQVKQLAAELKKINRKLDEEFAKNSIPFTPKAYKGRKGKSNRVVVVELFTGAQCPPCIAADVAFDAAIKTYKSKDVVFLQYHLHVPGPDPLTNPENDSRATFYDLEGTPDSLINGKRSEFLGGPKGLAEARYEQLTEMLNKALESETKIDIDLAAKKSGAAIKLTAKVNGLKNPGKNMRLHLVLIEDVVRYAGGNRQRLHHHVVRDLVGGAKGIPLDKASKTVKEEVNLDTLQTKLNKYLAIAGPFVSDFDPINHNHLKVVAFVQDHDSKEILNAVQVDVK